MLKTKQIVKPVMLACSAGLLLTACATDRQDRYAGTYDAGYATGEIREGAGTQAQWQTGAAQRGYHQQHGQQQYTQQQRIGADQQFQAQQQQQQQPYTAGTQQQIQGDQLVIPLHEEQLRVGTRTVDAGTVTIRKIVTTETVNQPVEIRRERLVIDRHGGGAQFGAAQQQQGIGARAQAGQAEFQGQAQFGEPAGAARGQQGGAAFQEQTYTIQLREEQPVVQREVVQTGQVVARKTAETQRQNVQQQVRREDVRLDQGAARNVEVRGDIQAAGQIREPAGAERQEIQREQDVQIERQQDLRMQDDAQLQRDAEIREPAGAQREIRTYETEIRTEQGAQQQGLPVRRGEGAFEDFREGSGTRGGAAELRGLDTRRDRR
ncbi:MAG: YsnF/AvaK domain-containing protein [Limisphaerales bacterium]